MLRRGDRDGQGSGRGLAPLLTDLLASRPELEAHVLCWDYSLLFALEREALPRLKMGWATHDRLHFEMDGAHPTGASHHEKVVVVNDQVAFIGGLDLTAHRSDTRGHPSSDPRRVDPTGTPYRPFHDLQSVVSGEVATLLGDLCRERWLRATGERLQAPEASAVGDPWPGAVEPAVCDISVGVTRTRGQLDSRPAVHETERFLVGAIESARRFVYAENQYFTSVAIGEAIARRLRGDESPDVLVVTTVESSGWLEQATMGARRARLCRRLEEADKRRRFAILAPVAARGESPNVHSKLMIVDDRAFYLGSANFSNRSIGLDSEAGVVAESDGRDDLAAALQTLRRSLLAEHLGVEPAVVAETESATGSVLRVVELLRRWHRTLEPIAADVSEWRQALLPLAALADPEQPITAERIMGEIGFVQDDG